jgi:multiple sugar transport system substrate-binding protein
MQQPLTRRDVLKSGVGLLASASVLSLAACGGGSSTGASQGGQTIRVLIGYNSTYPKQQQQWFQTMTAQFKKQTGNTVVWQTYSSSNEEQTTLQTSIVSGTGPDIFDLGTTFVPTAQATGGFVTLTQSDWNEAGGESRFFKPQLTMSGSSPSQYIAIPFVMRPFVMVYNTELFQKAGITAPPTTWTEFVQDAQKMTDPAAGIYGTTMDPSDSYDPWKIWWTFAKQLGKDFISSDLKTAQLNTPEAVQAVQFWFDWATKFKIVDPNSMSWKAGDATKAFANGKAGMVIMVSTSIIPTLNNSAVAGKYAFAPLPNIPYGMTQRPPGGVPAESIISGDMLAIASYSKVKDQALQFIKFLTDVQNQIQYQKTFGDLPVNIQAANQLASQSSQIAAFVQAEQGADPTPFTGAWGALEVALAGVSSKLANQVATNTYSPANVKPLLDQANAQIQSQLH